MVPLKARISAPFTAAHLAAAARAEQTGNSRLLEIATALDKLEEIDEDTQNNQALAVTKDMIQVATAIQDPNEGQQVIQDIVQEHRTKSWNELQTEFQETESFKQTQVARAWTSTTLESITAVMKTQIREDSNETEISIEQLQIIETTNLNLIKHGEKTMLALLRA